MNINLTYHEFILYAIIFVRMATILLAGPFFGFTAVPAIAKAGLAALLTALIFPYIDQASLSISTQLWPFILSAMNQVLIGLIIGFAADFLFVGVRYAGTLVGMDMGFGIVNVIDPQSGAQVSLVGQFKFLLATLLFIVMDGHLFLLQIFATIPGVVKFALPAIQVIFKIRLSLHCKSIAKWIY